MAHSARLSPISALLKPISGGLVTPPLPVLSTVGVAAGYGAGDIIRDITIDVTPGEVFTVIGPNGSGKSTLIKVLAGLVRSRVGEIRLGRCG